MMQYEVSFNEPEVGESFRLLNGEDLPLYVARQVCELILDLGSRFVSLRIVCEDWTCHVRVRS